MARPAILAAVAALVLAAPAMAQARGQLLGVVQDTGGTPIARADVTLQPLGRSAQSAANGQFGWRDLAPGEYRVLVSLIGYRPKAQTVRVGPGGVTRVTVALVPTPLSLQGIEVTANPMSRSPEAVTQSTTQLSGKALERELGGTIAQTLRFQPGVAVRFNGPAAAVPVLRGLTGDRILLLQDGLRSADLAGSAADHALTVDPLSAQRVEVVRGPATLLYGNNALGGVVNVISGDVATSAPARADAALTLQTESAQPGISASAKASAPIAGRWTVMARGGARTAGDMRIPREPVLGTRLDNTDARSWNAALGASHVSARWTAGAALRTYGFAYGIPVPPGAPLVRLRGDRLELVLRGEAELPLAALPALRIEGTVQEYAHDELDEAEVVQQRFELATRTANATFRQGTLGPLREGAFGISVLSRAYAATGPAALTPAADANTWGLFGYEEIMVHERVPRLQLGARFDEYRLESKDSEKFGAGIARRFRAVSGSAGVRQQLAEGINASLTVARSFRAPTVEELFSGAPHAGTGSVEYGTPTLRQERGRAVEVLLHWRGDRVNAQLSAYRNRIADFIQLAYTRDTTIAGATLPVFHYTQSDAELRGAEGALQLALTPRWVVGVQADALHAERTDGTPLSFMPPARAGAHVRWDSGRFSLGGELHHEFAQTRTGSADERPTPAHTLFRLDAGARLVWAGRTHSVNIRAENLGNELHRESTSRIKDFAPGPGRNIALVYRVYL